MHDILEGTLPLTLKELLKYCIQEKQYFTLAQLNSAICAFKYGPDKANKPCPITNIDHLKQNGTPISTILHCNHARFFRQPNVVPGSPSATIRWTFCPRRRSELGQLYSPTRHHRLLVCSYPYERKGGPHSNDGPVVPGRVHTALSGEKFDAEDALHGALSNLDKTVT